MGWWEWVKETTGRVTETIKTGLRGVIPMPEEIEPYLPTRPATEEQIAEAMEEALYAERFISEIETDQAVRLAKGVSEYEPLRNVARVRQWTAQLPEEIPASPTYQISTRGVLIAPDGQMTHVDVAFPTGEAYSYDEFVRRAASSLDDDFVAQYDVGRSQMIREWLVAQESYIQSYHTLAGF